MNLTKRSRSLITFLCLAVAVNACSMEQLPTSAEESSGWISLTENILLGVATIKQLWHQTEPFPFTGLPKELQNQIINLLSININAESLDVAAHTINALAQVNKELNQKINEPKFCLQLIKHLAKKFNCSDQTACAALQTHAAKQRLGLQMKLYDLCIYHRTSQKDFDEIYKSGTDLEFSYDYKKSEMTPLMIAAINNSNTLTYLLLENVDVNKSNKNGTTALMFAAKYKKSWAVEQLCKAPNIIVNQQDKNNNTALMYCIQTKLDNPLIIKTVKLLLNAGADPALGNNTGHTPLTIAQEKNNQAIIDLFKEAINKKYEKQ